MSKITTRKLNKFITLKLESRTSEMGYYSGNGTLVTNIYVNGNLFNQCKYLLLNLEKKDFKKFKDIKSIDEAFKIYNKMDKGHEFNKTIIEPEQEFIGHCSNIGAWIENGYDPAILHSSLSFPLLRELARCGDTMAIMVFKEEVLERIMNGTLDNITFFMKNKYIDIFNSQELWTLLDDIDERYGDRDIFDFKNQTEMAKEKKKYINIVKVLKKFINQREIIERMMENGKTRFKQKIIN